ncbi:MAG: hypothetical protein JST14_18390 [Bacteroidetes bacterium]|nr:hypothetical protein [Bacteroidota bacterium]MBS1978505.1 hypothetical protein [Bacteroidota bacterium]
MHSLFWVIWLLVWQTNVPYKPNDEFHIEVDLQLKEKPPADQTTIEFADTKVERKNSNQGGPLPFLILHLKVIKLRDGEVRIRGINNKGNVVLTKKAVAGESYRLTLGYVDDLKDRVTPYEFFLYFLNNKKDELSQVHILVTDDGTFLVNDEKRGKF